ncbi:MULTISPECIES: RidA family protein [Lysobacter]|uniref:Endoribonuclease L-PSP family protein n=3 Tax=Lysobacter TaxID=68 RepID=A0A0S2DHT3_LYSEN|nr:MULTISPECIES: RidA family protein [Lysobacter]ALN58247.1 endoribonuclease L-PSP family protein [Lysobacter enzymogenes]QCW26676.1 RidA family protein [Lysobacter enzymogenes]QQQ03424.1 RidA family protein [Lysobacter enzymogenes]WMT01835.1 RidA family protein [Lysobacter yananisis]
MHMQMQRRAIQPNDVSYAQAHEISGFRRLLFISGQLPQCEKCILPKDFEGQCRRAWANVEQQLKQAGMDFSNLVKVTTFLSERRLRERNYEIRREVLGEHTPALTVIIADLYEEGWMVEIEAIAAD